MKSVRLRDPIALDSEKDWGLNQAPKLSNGSVFCRSPWNVESLVRACVQKHKSQQQAQRALS